MENSNNKIINFISGSIFLIASNVCIKAINFFLLPLYTRNLTPSMIGISDSISSFTGILLPILTIGLDSAYSAFYFEKLDKTRGEKVFSTSSFALFFMGIIPLILLLFSGKIANYIFFNSEYKNIINIALLSVGINIWNISFMLELRMQNKMVLFGILNIIMSLTMVVLNILFVSVLQLNEKSLVLSMLLVQVECFVISRLFVGRNPKISNFDKELLKKMIAFAIPVLPSTLMMWVLSLSDRYILLNFCGSDSVGLYGIGLRFANLLNVFISAISMAYTTYAYGNKNDKPKTFYYIINFIFLALISVSFSISLFGKEIINFMTDELYKNSYVTLQNLMFSQIFYALTVFVGYGIFFAKKSIFSLLASTSGAIINLLLNIILIPKYGIVAAALTTLFGYVVYFIVTLFFSKKNYPYDYGENKIIIFTILMYFICLFSKELSFKYKIIIEIFYIVISILFYRNLLLKMVKIAKNFLNKRIKRNAYD